MQKNGLREAKEREQRGARSGGEAVEIGEENGCESCAASPAGVEAVKREGRAGVFGSSWTERKLTEKR
jgi:hypothetical protein